MFKIFYKCIFEGGSSNTLSYISISISVVSIGAAVYFIYLTKRMEVINAKFQKLCILNIDEFFNSIDDSFKSKLALVRYKKNATNFSINLQIFLISLKKIYPEINILEIIELIEKYSDYIYSLNSIDNSEIKTEYISMKLLVYDKLYNYALRNELSLFSRIGFKKLFLNPK